MNSFIFSSAEKARFDNYKVFTVQVENENQLEVLFEMEKTAFSSYDFWKNPSKVGNSVDIMVPPHKLSEFEEIMQSLQFSTSVKIFNVQELIDNEQPKISPRNDDFTWDKYHTLEEINAWLDQLLIDYAGVLTPVSAGSSLEGRPIRGVLLSYNPGNPAIFIESNTHAREWITSATATYVLNEFLTSTDPDIRRIAENYDWYIFPNVNPDGFAYSHRTNRMWRKTRARHGVICLGVDPNRNWAHAWQDGSSPGASNDVCSGTYAGPAAFSEPETRLLADFVLQRRDHIKMYLSYHSYSHLLLYPWSYTSDPADHYDDLHHIGTVTADRLKESYNTEYTVQSFFDLYISTGTSIDWAYAEAGIPLSYTYEFRDNGTYGFILPADQILPNSIEVLQSMIALCDESERLGYLPRREYKRAALGSERLQFIPVVRMRNLLVLAIVLLAAFSSAEKARFDNYRVYTVQVDNDEQLQVLYEMEKAAFSSYDFWKNPSYIGRPVEVMVPPHKFSEFEEIMESLQFQTSLKITNVQELVDKQQPEITPTSDFDWTRYQTMDEINAWMDQLIAQYPNVLTPLSYGNSYEMEPIRGVLVSHRAGNPAVFIEGNIHAREWISAATTTFVLNELLTSTDPEIRRLANDYDWYIFPVTNPDGYRHSHNTNRMWRKTRSRHGVICVGADPNRNFGYQWQDGSGPGASSNVCSEIFAGPAAFSELETGQLANFVLQRRDHIKVYLSFHSFSQLLLYPYAYTSTPSQNADHLHQIARVAADRLRGSFGTEYAVHSMNSLYIATGTSADWSYGGAGITLSYTYEFRDTGTHGFLLPPDQIIPNSVETVQSLIGMMDEAERLGYL
ncbi:uncharacterized protein LOC132257834 [Phlebotomus argentipes]|uniref:uncharacterized protein LOC132257834 n=1 Tax=Phlebotomus argentipes TaxID=94469 RepID=UPI002892F474|nr:uncharacterized protein LOC132257834 [Phlebotomus argentipes]